MTTTNKLQGWGLQTLDGVDFYLQRTAPAEAEAVHWLNMRAADDAVILEATAQGFTAAGRIAAFTGLTNVIGWYTHEALWHEGDTTALIDIGRRVSDVQRAYETLDPNEAQCLLQKYHVSYVVVGNFERESVQHIGILQQRDAALTKFKQFMDVAYTTSDDLRTSDVVIYQRRQNSSVVCSNPRSTMSH